MQAHVKIWFLSGGFERVDAENGRAQELATIYAEAETNDRVVAAELHREDGTVAASFDHRAPALDLRQYCGAHETHTGFDYECTLRGSHEQHQARGPEGQVFASWPAEPVPCRECGRRRSHKMDCSRGRLAPLT